MESRLYSWMSRVPRSCPSGFKGSVVSIARVACCVGLLFAGLSFARGANAQEASSLGEPVIGAARTPKDKADLRQWLENMISFHGMSFEEVEAAIDLPRDEIQSAIEELQLLPYQGVKRESASRLVMKPYPGGRHPRIGFLDGAIRPQRETKFSVFLPWDPTSYVVADIPEAIWSNLGLTYLAHTHIDTIWDQAGKKLEPLEWERKGEDHLSLERTLPNGIRFRSEAKVQGQQVLMRMSLYNGTGQMLSDLRVQNCIMLKAAKGFNQQVRENKVIRGSYVACHDEEKKRWIITSWQPIHRAWGNPPCPCLHADPRFPDTAAGESNELVGILSFYEGEEIETELNRLRHQNWELAWSNKPANN